MLRIIGDYVVRMRGEGGKMFAHCAEDVATLDTAGGDVLLIISFLVFLIFPS